MTQPVERIAGVEHRWARFSAGDPRVGRTVAASISASGTRSRPSSPRYRRAPSFGARSRTDALRIAEAAEPASRTVV
ncbi:MAG: hypothetical protein R3324_00030 [Halobacteriales archaeon]|nr:hypothetical protein [Halobacteriales archaeon]